MSRREGIAVEAAERDSWESEHPRPSPATAPNLEVFRFEKPGYLSLDVKARTATRLEAYRYRLEVHLEPESAR